jgi:hypothetical protein
MVYLATLKINSKHSRHFSQEEYLRSSSSETLQMINRLISYENARMYLKSKIIVIFSALLVSACAYFYQ